MHAYSTNLKVRLVRAVADGQPIREAARRFGVAATTVKRAVVRRRRRASGSRADFRLPTAHREGPGGWFARSAGGGTDANVLERCAWWA